MRRRLAVTLAALILSWVGLAAAMPLSAAAAPAPTPAPGPPQAKAWMLVDSDTGAVIEAFNDHALLRPASVEKIVTGLLAAAALPSDATVPVGADAAGEEAAKINMKAGQTWTFEDALHSLLMVSANDAAVALADRVSGSTTGFAQLAAVVGRRLGVRDSPVLNDPAGLDDSFAIGGGDFVSAWDLAVFTRAAMSLPAFSDAVRLPIYQFVGPDGVHHTLRNHNRLLLTDPTLVGVKPGYTRQAGDTYVAEAQRDGRAMVVVALGVAPATMYSGSEYLFAQGFATPPSAEPGADRLPPVLVPDVAALAASVQRGGAGLTPLPGSGSRPAAPGTSHPAVRSAAAGSGGSGLLRIVLVLLAAAVTWVVSRRRVGRPARRQRPRAAPAAARTSPRPARPPARVGGPAPRTERVGEGGRPVTISAARASGPPEGWEAAGAAWEQAVPTRLVDWAEWEILGAPERSRPQADRNRSAASIER